MGAHMDTPANRIAKQILKRCYMSSTDCNYQGISIRALALRSTITLALARRDAFVAWATPFISALDIERSYDSRHAVPQTKSVPASAKIGNVDQRSTVC